MPDAPGVLGALPVPPEPEPPAPEGIAPEAEPESANAPVLAHLVCTNPTCTHRGSTITVHEDTVLPIHCGGCFGVLHCAHDHETTTVQDGTIGAPVLVTTTRCKLCGTVADEKREPQPPIDLTSLPAAILTMPIAPGRIN